MGAGHCGSGHNNVAWRRPPDEGRPPTLPARVAAVRRGGRRDLADSVRSTEDARDRPLGPVRRSIRKFVAAQAGGTGPSPDDAVAAAEQEPKPQV